uniref:Terpene synthase n=1 Tax=Cannabis sativa TaxID=3483 RepID=A0A803R1P4_CANSA
MQCIAFHQFASSSSLPIWSSIDNRFTPKTSITSISKPKPKLKSKSNLKSRSRSSTCYPIQCTVVDNPSSTITNNSDRRSANYGPPIWSFDFVQSLPIQYKGESYTSRLNKLEKDVKRMLIGVENSLAQLELIDTIQRLGISYRFENEIISILKEKFTNNNNNPNPINYDLYATALQFRLLRQYGFEVPQEIFNNFKNHKTGEFKANISNDIMGALGLYEASFHGKKGESILEEARIFTTKCLKKYKLMSSSNNNNMTLISLLVNHALEMPLQWRITRSEAKWFIEEIYERKQDMNPTLLEFAKLDFNMLQSTYQEELKVLSRWWKDSKLGEKLPFVRDRLVECFLWQVGELQLFTNALQRWDLKELDKLPDYMKTAFYFTYNFTNELAFDVLQEHGFVHIEYFKKLMVELCKHHLQEAKWFYSGYKPTLQEYVENGWLSVGGQVILMHAYFAFTNPVTKEALECLKDGHPNIVRHASIILRLADDLGTLSDELKRGDVPKSIQCYMHDTGASEDEAREHIKYLISESWKEMNNEDGNINSFFSNEFVQVCKNLGRASQFMYQYGDGHASQNNLSKERVLGLIITPIPM